MNLLTQPLRDEHKELLPHIEDLRNIADLLGYESVDVVRDSIEEAYQFLEHQLIPHAKAEDIALYPVVGRALGSPEATATMSREHAAIAALTEELGRFRLALFDAALTDAQVREARRILYGLYAIIELHFAKEEEIYLPILESRISPEEAVQVFAAMEAAARKVKFQLA